MPLRPVLDGAWGFEFPTAGSVHYVILPINRPLEGTLRLVASIEASADAAFVPTDPGAGDGPYKPGMNLYFQRRGDDLTARMPHHRWWSISRLVLAPGTFTLEVPLQPDFWSSVFSANGASVLAEYNAARAECLNVGFTFGGGSNYGHGVHLTAGSARFRLKEFSIG